MTARRTTQFTTENDACGRLWAAGIVRFAHASAIPPQGFGGGYLGAAPRLNQDGSYPGVFARALTKDSTCNKPI